MTYGFSTSRSGAQLSGVDGESSNSPTTAEAMTLDANWGPAGVQSSPGVAKLGPIYA